MAVTYDVRILYPSLWLQQMAGKRDAPERLSSAQATRPTEAAGSNRKRGRNWQTPHGTPQTVNPPSQTSADLVSRGAMSWATCAQPIKLFLAMRTCGSKDATRCLDSALRYFIKQPRGSKVWGGLLAGPGIVAFLRAGRLLSLFSQPPRRLVALQGNLSEMTD